jgi:hypothetical protein
MPRGRPRAENGEGEERGQETQPEQPAATDGGGKIEETAYAQMRKLGYTQYTPTTGLILFDAEIYPAEPPEAKRVNINPIREDNGKIERVGLGFIGPLDEPLFYLVIPRDELLQSVAKPLPNSNAKYVGLAFMGKNRTRGPIGLLSMETNAYKRFSAEAEKIGE